MTKVEIKELTAMLEKQWNDPKMVKHCLKAKKYIKIDDLIVEVCDLKPTIKSTMLYDDEYAAPEVNYKNFIRYNLRSMPEKKELRKYGRELHYIIGYWDDKTDGKLVSLMLIGEEDNRYADSTIRKVTAEELEQINDAIEEVRDDYQKRLDRYFKRYGDKITTYGYWANR